MVGSVCQAQQDLNYNKLLEIKGFKVLKSILKKEEFSKGYEFCGIDSIDRHVALPAFISIINDTNDYVKLLNLWMVNTDTSIFQLNYDKLKLPCWLRQFPKKMKKKHYLVHSCQPFIFRDYLLISFVLVRSDRVIAYTVAIILNKSYQLLSYEIEYFN